MKNNFEIAMQYVDRGKDPDKYYELMSKSIKYKIKEGLLKEITTPPTTQYPVMSCKNGNYIWTIPTSNDRPIKYI